MSLRIFSVDETKQPPQDVWLELTCDGDHGFMPATSATFSQYGYITQRKAATAAGWRFTVDGKNFGPCCPKAVREEGDALLFAEVTT